MMLVIGLTGGIGSGKTTVGELFAQKGILIIDADQITRDITQPGQPALQAIIAHFGHKILNNDQSLNRQQLKTIIFSNEKEKQWLEQLLHPLVRAEIKNQVATCHSPYAIAIIPLLLETEKNPFISRILVIDTPKEQQLERTKNRDQLPDEAIHAIMKTQINREKRLLAADDVIINDSHLEKLIAQVEKLHLLYLKLSQNF